MAGNPSVSEQNLRMMSLLPVGQLAKTDPASRGEAASSNSECSTVIG
jgi:hypothetical protein